MLRLGLTGSALLAGVVMLAVATDRPMIGREQESVVTPVPDPASEPERTVFLDTNGNFHLYGHPLEWVWVWNHKVPENLSGRCKASIREWPRAVQSTHSGLVLKELVLCFGDDRLATEIYGSTGGKADP